MDEKKNPYCIWMVGLSGSGKTIVAEEYSQKYNAQILSSDSIREELYGDESIQGNSQDVFDMLYKRASELLKNGISIIYDATNITRKNRSKFFNYCKQKNIQAIHHAVILCTPYNICLRRNQNRSRQVPEDVIHNQMCRFNIPFFEEGFNYITLYGWNDNFHDITINSEKQDLHWNINNFIAMLSKMQGFNQNNHHHKLDLYAHSLKVSEILNQLTENRALLTAGMVHDIGKVYTKTFDENKEAHYYNHAEVGTYTLLSNLDVLELNESEILKCLFYVNYHMYPFSWEDNKTKEKYKKIFGETNYDYLCLLNYADKESCK